MKLVFSCSIVKMSLLLLLLSLIPCSDAVVYYISADLITDDTCVDNSNATLGPCYSLHQLCNGNGLLVNKASITLHLLSGIHVLPEDCSLLLSEIAEAEISPWNQQQKEFIECHTGANITFQDIGKLSIFSLNFTHCELFLNHAVVGFFRPQAFIDQCVFAESEGDYAIAIARTSMKFTISINNTMFLSNNGAVLCECIPQPFSCDNSIVISIRNTMFLNNTRTTGDGGALSVSYVDIELYGSSFINNTAADSGGAVMMESCSALIISKTNFLNNRATHSGGAILQHNSYSSIEYCLFKSNYAELQGGAIWSLGLQHSSIGDTNFLDNYVSGSGGAIYSDHTDINNCQFKSNSAAISGGAVYFFDARYGYLSNSLFYLNKARLDGGAIYFKQSRREYSDFEFVQLAGGNATMNSARNGGFLYSSSCTVSIQGTYYIVGNKATNGGAIFINDSVESVDSQELSLINNTAKENGGAIYAMNSVIVVEGQMIYSHNAAARKGGAIYISDDHCENVVNVTDDCSISHKGGKSIFFSNNTATYGPILYGGLLDRCYDVNSHTYGIQAFKMASEYEQAPLAITSDPVKVCFCLGNFQLNCARRYVVYRAMRGESIEAIITSVDQDENPVASIVRFNYEKTTAILGEGEGRNKLNNSCTTLHFHIFTALSSAKLILQLEGVCERSPLSNLAIIIELVNCSRGFEQNKDRCVCDRRLRQYLNVTNCLLETHSVERREPIWLRYEEDSLKMARNCPLDYCQVTSNSISLLAPDDPCANHRSGILCGACQHNYSIALGGSRCLPCTEKKYTSIWLILVFAVAGIALVALLLVCNITISHGTLNGLVFYANVVSISGLTSLHNCSIHPVLSVFIAWLNLDFGVETCFYPGMDTYQKTWLQFAFPLYIVLLVIVILVASYYSSTAMKVFGRNNIAILATLFFLSYSKTLKTIISALSAKQVLASDADNVSAPVLPYTVWSHDGNIEYLKGKHIVCSLPCLCH